MDRSDIVRTDFPEAAPGFEKSSVEAHLEAVAAQLAALEARAWALEVELGAVRAGGTTESGAGDPREAPAPPAGEDGEVGDREEDGATDPVAARLVATELALDGTSRDRIIERIEAEYGIRDVAELVDEVIARTS